MVSFRFYVSGFSHHCGCVKRNDETKNKQKHYPYGSEVVEQREMENVAYQKEKEKEKEKGVCAGTRSALETLEP